MLITLEPDSPVPLFEQLHDAILNGIATGELRDGDRLDPVRKVAADFGINPATVKKAYDQLAAEGIIETRGRSGSVVRLGQGASASAAAEMERDVRRTLTRARAQGFAAADIQKLIDTTLAQLKDLS